MRTRIALALSIALVGISTIPASGATKPTVVTAAFKNLLSATNDSLDQLDQKYEIDVNALDLALENATAVANANYATEIQSNFERFTPVINSLNGAISDARSKFKNVSTVTVLALGTNRNYWGNLNCPPSRTNCIDVDKGEKFNIGEITTLKEIISTTPAYLQEIDIMLSLGLIKLNSPTDYLAVSKTLKNTPSELESIQAQYAAVQNSSIHRRDSAIQVATAQRVKSLTELDEVYQAAKTDLEAQQNAANLALLATKRASKDPGVFDKAFAVAYKFEYNKKMVDQIADDAWTGEWTFRTIDSILKVNKLAVYGDGIASKYSMSAANSFNSAVGNAFTNEPEFRAALKVLTSLYKKTTSTTLKF